MPHPSKPSNAKKLKNNSSEKIADRRFWIGFSVMLLTTLIFGGFYLYLVSDNNYVKELTEKLLADGIRTKATIKAKHKVISNSTIIDKYNHGKSYSGSAPLENIDPRWEFVSAKNLNTAYFLEISYYSGNYKDPMDGFDVSLGDFLDEICVGSTEKCKDFDEKRKQKALEKAAEEAKINKSLEPPKQHRWAIEVSSTMFNEVNRFDRVPALYLDGKYDSLRLLRKDGRIDRPRLGLFSWVTLFLFLASLAAVINGIRTKSWG